MDWLSFFIVVLTGNFFISIIVSIRHCFNEELLLALIFAVLAVLSAASAIGLCE